MPAKTLLLLCVFFIGACKQNSAPQWITTPSGLKYIVIKEGSGPAAQIGQAVMIHEKMSYPNDSLLFSSYNLPGPVKVLIGGSQAIQGLDEALTGMKKGEIKKLLVPPTLSKRSGHPTFPHPDSTLLYEVEVVELLPLSSP